MRDGRVSGVGRVHVGDAVCPECFARSPVPNSPGGAGSIPCCLGFFWVYAERTFCLFQVVPVIPDKVAFLNFGACAFLLPAETHSLAACLRKVAAYFPVKKGG